MDSNKDKIISSEMSDNQKSLASKDSDTSLYISKDKNFSFTHQKVKKLAAAVYMITNFFADQEPLKWSLRALSTELLKRNIATKDTVFGYTEHAQEKIRETILETVSLLEVGSFAGLVSPMNVTILKKEFNELLEKMNAISASSQKNSALSTEQFFFVEEPKKDAPAQPFNQMQDPSYGQHLRKPMKDNSPVLYPDSKNDTPIQRHEEDSQSPERATLKDYSPVAVKKNKRQSTIINLIKRKREIMIKDVVGLISDCSEKTIQRELLALVDEGVLRKEGERRWTKYSLV
jgi:hypothetical protein